MDYDELLEKSKIYARKIYSSYIDNPGIYESHIRHVMMFALKLAEIEGADKEVVELAALFHDLGNINGRENHNETSYEYAKDFLRTTDLSDKKKYLILECIYKHRADFKHNSEFPTENDKIEVKIIQSADVLARLFDDKFQEESIKTVPKEKLEKILKKAERKITLESAKKIAKPKIDKIKKLLQSV